jgi:hypothetical protein
LEAAPAHPLASRRRKIYTFVFTFLLRQCLCPPRAALTLTAAAAWQDANPLSAPEKADRVKAKAGLTDVIYSTSILTANCAIGSPNNSYNLTQQ